MPKIHGSVESYDAARRSVDVDSDTEKLSSSSPTTCDPRPLESDTEVAISWRSIFAFTTRKHLLPLVAAISFAIMAGAVSPIMGIFFGKVLNTFTESGGEAIAANEFRRKVSQDCIYLAILGVSTWILDATYFMLWLYFGELQARECRLEIFDGLLEKQTAWYDTRSSGISALTPRVQSQIRELQLATSQPMGSVLQFLIMAITSLTLAFYYCWDLTLVIIATLPVSAFVLSFISSRMQPSIIAHQQEMSTAIKTTIGAFSAIETIKCFNGQELETNKFANAIHRAATYYIRQATVTATQIGFARFVTMSMFVQGFWYGSHLVISGKRSTGDIVTTFSCALTAMSTVEHVLPQLIVLEKGRTAGAALQSLVAILRNEDTEPEVARKNTASNLFGEIEFRKVTFNYPTRPRDIALKNLCCSFPAGSTTFIIGRSGSGKSTLAQLLLRFYEPASGQILLDGKQLSDIGAKWLRQNIILVEQQTNLFNGTLLENLLLGVTGGRCSMEDVTRAIEFALLQETINDLPDGLNTFIMGKESNLSGGQRQRMAIARARLRDSPIVIFDESTSALDQTNRSLILAAIRRWRKGRTTIFISHDISQIEPQDYVCILRDGQLIQQGRRGDLEVSDASSLSTYLDQTCTTKEDENNLFDDVQSHRYAQSITSPVSSVDDELLRAFGQPLQQKRRSRLSYIPTIYRTERPDSIVIFKSPALTTALTSGIAPNRTDASILRRSSTISEGSPDCLSPSSPRESIFERLSTRFGMESADIMLSAGVGGMENSSTTEKRVKRFGNTQSIQDTYELDKLDESKSPLIGPLQSGPPKISILDILKTVWPNLNRESRTCLISGFCSAAIHAVISPLFSWIFSKLLGTFYVTEHASQSAKEWSLLILGLAVVDALVSYLMHIQLETSGQAWVDKIRVSAMDRILSQPREFFGEEENSPAALAQSLDRNAEEMRNLLGRFAALMFVAIVLMITALVWSLIVCWKLTLIALCMAPVSFAITRCFQAISAKYEALSNDMAEVAGSFLDETCTNIKTVRALTLESHFRSKHANAAEQCLHIGIRRAIYSGIFYGLSESTIDFFNALLFYAGAVLASSGHYSVQDILTVFSMLLFSMANVTTLMGFLPQINSSKDTASRLLHLAQGLPPKSHEDDGTVRLSSIGDIRFRNLSFAYPSRPSEQILHNVNLTIRAGTIAALVGASGSGKSTIASLLLRLYPLSPSTSQQTSHISISARSLPRLHTPTLRSLIAVVPQSCTLFPATIAQNITYGLAPTHPHASPSNIIAAAKAAGIHDFIASLPLGYATPVGEGGTALSGGQTQRLAIARALVRHPKMLILDEATSALDVEGAGMVREILRELIREREGMTVLVITHDKTMMAVAERVVVLERGRVVEEGRFEELVRGGGAFERLVGGR